MILIAGILILIVFAYLIYRKLDAIQGNRALDVLVKSMDDVNRRLKDSTEEISKVAELGRDMKGFQKDFESFFANPKRRGNIGEQVLKDLVVQILPKENYAFQHSFSEGQIVDAIIRTDKGIIPVDSKFPIDNFKKYLRSEDDVFKKAFLKDVEKHVKAIAEKYIRPGEGTIDFALMYVPSEAVYYELMMGSDVVDYARDKKVLIVSPNSFYYFLQTILIGLEGKKVEQRAREILSALRAVQKSYRDFGETLSTLNRHITNAKSSMDKVNSEYTQIQGLVNDRTLLDYKRDSEE